jgi:hypothetical protein
MEGGKITMDNYGIIICADLNNDEPQYLCLRENGELYVCKVDKDKGKFIEKDICVLTMQEAMMFASNSFCKTMLIIQCHS